MNCEVNIDNKKKKLKLYYGFLVTVICIIGVSFAWFRLYLSQTENNTIASRTCFNTTLTEDTSKISLTDAFPIIDEDGLKQTPFTFTIKNNCNSYVKVYITIDSTYRESTDTSYLKDSYMKVNISPKGTTTGKSVILGSQTLTDLENNRKGYIIVSTGLKANEEKSYDLRIWMDSAVTTEQGLNKNWSGKIVVVTAASYPTLADSILTNNEVKVPLTIPGVETSGHSLRNSKKYKEDVSSSYQKYYITYGTGWEANGTKFNLTGTAVTTDTYANSYSSLVGKYIPNSRLSASGSSTAGEMKQTTNLSGVYHIEVATANYIIYTKITSNKNAMEALLASTEDDYGTSYYFRGAVKNNYVEFANKCWRIVRITGDGSLKLVLQNDNVNNVKNPCSTANRSNNATFAHYDGTTFSSKFNEDYKDNTYMGFMYGQVGASDYTSAQSNINKSTILTNLETWYLANLKNYDNYLADIIWCNDKSTFTTYNNGSNFGVGYGYEEYQTGYGAYKRLFDGGDSYSTLLSSPSLICPNDNNGGKLSKFTVNDTVNGNGVLTYKIGLLTADELAYAGLIYNVENPTTYLSDNANTSDYWWTMSPSYFYGKSLGVTNSSKGEVWEFASGRLSTEMISASNGLRPVIALTSSTTISRGTGTSEDPYVVN